MTDIQIVSKPTAMDIATDISASNLSDQDKFLLQLTKTSLGELRDYEVVVVDQFDKLSFVFTTLVENDIYSCPVVDKKNRYVGMVSMYTCLELAIEYFGGCLQRPEKGSSDYIIQKNRWRNSQVRDVMTTVESFDQNQSLLTALETLSRYDEKAMAVCDSNRKVTSIITHFTILEWVLNNIHLYPKIDITSFSEIRPYRWVRTFPETATAMKAFKVMNEEKLGSVGIVNDDNILVDVLSVKDLKGISPGSQTFRWLFNSIRFFKDNTKDQDWSTPTTPITVEMADSTTFGDILRKIIKEKVHRVFVCDKEKGGQCYDIITTTDLIQFLLQMRYSGVGMPID